MLNTLVMAMVLYCADTKQASRKHAYIILTPLKPDFYISKTGFTGVYIIFLISAENLDCGTR